MQLKIYVVEDDLLMQASLKHLILTMGHELVGIASSYEKAISDLDILTVDLLVTDIMISGSKTGIDIITYLKEKLFTVPFIFQSSIIDTEMISVALGTLPLAYLAKPVKRADFYKAIAGLSQQIFN